MFVRSGLASTVQLSKLTWMDRIDRMRTETDQD